jgi:hypothetical protein
MYDNRFAPTLTGYRLLVSSRTGFPSVGASTYVEVRDE